MIIKNIAKIFLVLILGALGALIFEYFIFPKMIPDRNVIINKTEQVYIQENVVLENAIKNAQKSIVSIQNNGVVAGSGLIATSDGLIVTLASLISNNSKIILYKEDTPYKIIKKDFKNNLALIKVEKNNLPTVGFANFDKVMLGQRVFLTGFNFANEGIIRSFDKNIIKTNISEKYIALGTPLFNISGELVGINFIDQDGKISAISVDTIKTFLGL